MVLTYADYCCVVASQQLLPQTKPWGSTKPQHGSYLIQAPRTPSAPLRNQLRWTTLHKWGHNSMLCQVHWCVLKQAPSYPVSGKSKNWCIYSSTRGANEVHRPQPRTETYRSSFEFQGALEYNQLPRTIRCTSSLHSFKHAILNLKIC